MFILVQDVTEMMKSYDVALVHRVLIEEFRINGKFLPPDVKKGVHVDIQVNLIFLYKKNMTGEKI